MTHNERSRLREAIRLISNTEDAQGYETGMETLCELAGYDTSTFKRWRNARTMTLAEVCAASGNEPKSLTP